MSIDTNAATLLKQRATDKFEENVVTNNPVLGILKKEFGIGGSGLQYAIQTGGIVARGARYQDCLASAATSSKVEGIAVALQLYGMAQVGGLEAALSRGGGKNSIADLLGVEQDVAYSQMGSMIEQILVAGDSFGTIATVSSVVSGTTGSVVLQLVNFNDCFNIFVGDLVRFKSNPKTASLQTGGMTVTASDPMTGQITGTMTGSGDATSYAGYGIGLSATYFNSTAPQTPNGFRNLFTRTNLSDTLDGITTRANDPVRLGGHVFSVGGMSAKDSISLLIASVGQFSTAKSKYAVVSSNTMLELQEDLGSMVRFTSTSGQGPGKGANVQFNSITYQSGMGEVTVLCAPKCSDKDIWLIDPSTITINCVDSDLIMPVDKGDSGWIRLQTADAHRLDLRSFFSVTCDKFLANGRAIRA